jgi:membrane-bound serine protease (ClpP class)
MWIAAGVLIGLVVIASLAGFHLGPHVHFAAGVLGIVAAAWLVMMLIQGRSASAVWALLAAVLVVSAAAVAVGWVGLSGRGTVAYHPERIEGAEGIAVNDLAPDGLVRVRGEQWSATSVNGTARAGTRVQVLRVSGLRLDVWAEEPEVHADGWN